MRENPPIGMLLHRSSNNIARTLDNLTSEYNITGKQARILNFLVRKQDEVICQKDIEQKFGIRRSSVSNLIDNLVKNNYLTRVELGSDARMKQLMLTKEGIAVHRIIYSMIEEIEDMIKALYSEEEYLLFNDFLQRCVRGTKDGKTNCCEEDERT